MRETERLKILHQYEILDTPREAAFDKITKMACCIFNVPISTISFVDSDRIWYKSSYGIDLIELPFEEGLCGTAVFERSHYVIENVLTDPRTQNSILVKGDFGLQFYAAYPLYIQDGCSIGVLNIIDKKSRIFTEHEAEILRNLALLVVHILNLRHREKKAVQSEINMGNMLKAIYNSTTEATTFVDVNYKLVYFNDMAEIICQRVFGAAPKVGDHFLNWMRPHLREEFKGLFEQVLKGKSITNQQKDGNDWYQFDYFPVYNDSKVLVGGAQCIKLITERKENELKIIEQNEKLRAIAWTQSHELRQPVAQILGLIQLIKSEKISAYDKQEKHIDFLYQAAENLDIVIHKIVRLTESV